MCMRSDLSAAVLHDHYSGTSLISNRAPLGPYSRTAPRVLWWSQGRGSVSYERGTPVTKKNGNARLQGEGTTENIFKAFTLKMLKPGLDPAHGWLMCAKLASQRLQGYLAPKKQRSPRTLQQD